MSPLGSRRVLWILLGAILAILALTVAIRSLRTKNSPTPLSPPSGGDPEPGKKQLYHCPMHPTMVADKPGDCPICGMRLVPVEEPQESPAPQPAPAPAATGGKKVVYRSTMLPNEISDRPGKDSMGMEMVPVEVEEETGPGSKVPGLASVRIPIRKQQLIGIRTSLVKRAPFVRNIRAVGRVTPDETRLRHIHAKIGGWVEHLHVNTTGEKVLKGQPLLSLYSPELVATQQEYLVALRARQATREGTLPEVAKGSDELLESTRRRLLLFDLTEEQIDRLDSTGQASRTITLFSPVSGYVLQRNVTHGEKIDSNVTLFDIADLSKVWVLASIYEYELPFVRAGQSARVTLSYLPGRDFLGRVALVYPVLEGATRTAQVRIELSNPDLTLKPEMYAEVELMADLGQRLVVPDTAVLSSGTRYVVFVDQGDGYFEPREVRIGLRLPDTVEILDGLTEGETVITSGNFFVDSESKLKAALEAATTSMPGKEQ